MCGFICIVSRDQDHPQSGPVLSPQSLTHRGPDYTSEFVESRVAIRHWRLSIVDLSERSNQPIITDKNIFAFNGEIYDYKKLGKQFNIQAHGDSLDRKSVV